MTLSFKLIFLLFVCSFFSFFRFLYLEMRPQKQITSYHSALHALCSVHFRPSQKWNTFERFLEDVFERFLEDLFVFGPVTVYDNFVFSRSLQSHLNQRSRVKYLFNFRSDQFQQLRLVFDLSHSQFRHPLCKTSHSVYIRRAWAGRSAHQNSMLAGICY